MIRYIIHNNNKEELSVDHHIGICLFDILPESVHALCACFQCIFSSQTKQSKLWASLFYFILVSSVVGLIVDWWNPKSY